MVSLPVNPRKETVWFTVAVILLIAIASALGSGIQGTIPLSQLTPIASPTVVCNNSGSTAAPSACTVTGTGSPVLGTAPTITNPVIANINPGADFTITQNSNAVITSVNAGAATTMYIDGGKVGIGTGSTQAAKPLEVENNVSSGSAWPQLRLTNAANYISGFSLVRSGGGAGSEWIIYRYGGGSNDKFAIAVNAVNEPFVITTGGAVGLSGNLGTSISPSYGLDVGASVGSGTARFYDQTASTGATKVVVTPGAAQNSGAFLVQNGGATQATAFQSTGTTFTISGCSATSPTGGATAGTYASGTTGTCTVTITFNGATGITANNGWACVANDQTTPADLQHQTASNTTTATISGTTVSGDVISFACTAY